jgi:hypothetical protein
MGEFLSELSSFKIDVLEISISKVILHNGSLRAGEILTGCKILWGDHEASFEGPSAMPSSSPIQEVIGQE